MMKERFGRLVKETARDLRKKQTNSEQLLWEIIRNRNILGKKFLRQYPIYYRWRGQKRFFIVDFFCSEYNLVVEVDGAIHDTQKDYDKERDYVLRSMGAEVLRFKNEYIKNNIQEVIETIKEKLSASTPSLVKRGGRGVS